LRSGSVKRLEPPFPGLEKLTLGIGLIAPREIARNGGKISAELLAIMTGHSFVAFAGLQFRCS
jgi:hypothetical protein